MAGRPRTFDRDAALDVAVEQFWVNGYDHTTVATLTQAIGISPPSLYAAFGDKDRLFDEAVRCYSERTLAGTVAALERPDTRAALGRLLEVTASAHTDQSGPRGCLVLSEPRLSVQRDGLREVIAARIRDGRDQGDVPSEVDPDALAEFVLATLAGMSARARDGATPEQVRAIAEIGAAAVGALLTRPRGLTDTGG